MVPSSSSENQGGPRQRTSCQSPATEKRKVTPLLQLPSMHQCHFRRPTLLYVAIELVFICKNSHTHGANLPSVFRSYLL